MYTKHFSHQLVSFFLCYFISIFFLPTLVSANNKTNPLQQYQIIESVSNVKPGKIAQDIINQLVREQYSSVNDYFSFLIAEKPMSTEGTRLLEEVYSALVKIGDKETFATWCKPDNQSPAAFIIMGRWHIGKAWKIRGTGWGYTISGERSRLMKENYDKAHKNLLKAYEMNPADPGSATWMIAVCQGKALPTQVMESWFEKAVAADPVSLTAYQRKFNYLMPIWFGSQEQLKEFSENCYRKSPAGSAVYSMMLQYIDYTAQYVVRGNGSIKNYVEQPDVKIYINSIFKRLQKDFPNSIRFTMKRAKFYFHEDETGKALDVYNEIIHEHPEYAAAYEKRAYFYHGNSLYNKAEADYLKLTTLEPENAFAYHQLADIYQVRDHDNKKFLANLSKAIELQPNDKRFSISRGAFYQGHQEYEKSIEDFNAALSIDPYNKHALSLRAESYERLNLLDKAIADYLKVKELSDGKNNGVEIQLNRLLELVKKKEAAPLVVQTGIPPAPQAVAKKPGLHPQEVISFIQQGEAHFYRRKVGPAKEIFKQILQKEPENSYANFMMGQIADKLENNYQQSVTYYSRAISSENKNGKYLSARGIALFMLRRYKQAISDFTSILEVSPHDGPAVYYRALCFDALGNKKAAIADMKLAAMYSLDLADEANKYLNKHAAKDPFPAVHTDPIEELTMLASQDMRLNRYNEAEKTWKEIISKDPKNDYAIFQLGMIAIYHDKDHKKAISYYDQAIKLDNTRSDYYINRGFALGYLGDYLAAIDNYSALLAIKPKHGKAYYYRAECYEKEGEYVKAEEDFRKAKKYRPELTKSIERKLAGLSVKTGTEVPPTLKNVDFLLSRSDKYLADNEIDQSIKDLETVIDLDPENDKALYKLGRIYEKKIINREKAVAFYSQAIQFNELNTKYTFQRGLAYYHLKAYELASKDFTTCINRKPNGRMYYYRGMSNKKLNKRDQAIDDLLKAKELDSSWADGVNRALSGMI